MNLHLTGHHVQITPAIRDYIDSKLDRIGHHLDKAIDVNIILSVEKLQQKVEATASAGRSSPAPAAFRAPRS